MWKYSRKIPTICHSNPQLGDDMPPKMFRALFSVYVCAYVVERIYVRNDTYRFVSFYLDKFKRAPVHGCVCLLCLKWVMLNCFLLSLLFHSLFLSLPFALSLSPARFHSHTCNFDHWIRPIHRDEFLHANFAP